jgi:hypothetical protein
MIPCCKKPILVGFDWLGVTTCLRNGADAATLSVPKCKTIQRQAQGFIEDTCPQPGYQLAGLAATVPAVNGGKAISWLALHDNSLRCD